MPSLAGLSPHHNYLNCQDATSAPVEPSHRIPQASGIQAQPLPLSTLCPPCVPSLHISQHLSRAHALLGRSKAADISTTLTVITQMAVKDRRKHQ